MGAVSGSAAFCIQSVYLNDTTSVFLSILFSEPLRFLLSATNVRTIY